MASGNEEVIDKYVDRTGFASDTKFVLENLNTIFEAYKRIAEVRIGLGNVQGLAGIVPLAKEAQKELDKITSASTKLDEQFEKNRQSTAKLTEEQRKQFAATGNIGKSYKELFVELGRLTDEQTKIAEQVAKVNDAFNKGSISQERYVEQLAELNLEQGKVAVSIDLVSKAMKNIEKSSQASAGSLDELKAQLALAKQAFDALSDADKQAGTGTELLTKIKALDTAIKAQLSATTEVTDQQRELDKAYIESRISKQEYNKELKLELALQNSLEGSIERARAEVKALTAERDKLNLTTEEGRIRQAELNKQIDANNDFIRENVDTLSKQKINVGNYQGSAKIIVDALGDVTKKIEELKVKQQGLQDFSKRNPIGFKTSGGQNDLDQTTAQLKQLTAQASALNNITSKPQFLNIAGKVGDTNKELRFFQQQLNALEDAGQKNSQVYKDVQTRLAQLTDQIGDTRAEIKALSSDSRSFDLFAGSVNFAADVFQTAAGAAALFVDNEEEVARVTKTLIAVQSISNGVKGIANELTTKGTAANKVFAFVQGLVSTSLDKTAAAGKRATAALGLLGIAVTVIGAVVIAMSQLNKALSEGERRRKIFNDIQEEAIKGYAAEVTKLEVLKKVITDTTLSTDKRKTAVKEYNKVADEGNKIDEKQINNGALIEETINRQIELIKKRGLARAAETVIAEKAEALFLKQLELEERFPEFGEKALAGLEKTAQDIVNKKAEIAGLKNVTAAELLAFADLPDDQIQAIAKKNSRVSLLLDSSTKSLLLSLRNQQKQIQDSRKNLTGGKAGLQVLIDDIEQATKDLDSATKIGLDFIGDVGGQFTTPGTGSDAGKQLEEQKKAALELFKFRQQQIIEENKKIAEAEILFSETRITALQRIAQAEKAIITAQAAFDLSRKGILAAEKTKIEEEYAANVIKINEDLGIEIATIQGKEKIKLSAERERLLAEEKELLDKRAADEEAALNKQVKDLKDNLEERLSIIKRSADREQTELNKKYAKGLISAEDFEKERKRIEARAAKKALDAQLEFAEKLIKPTTKKFGNDSEEVRELLERIDELKKKLSELEIPEPTKNFREKLEKFLTDLADYASQIGSVISDALDAAATKQKNIIQEEIDLIDERTAKELEAINQTTANKEEAANKIAIVEARAAAQKRVLEQRQREIDRRKAQFDKANTISQIIINTALSVVKAAGRSIFEAIAVGAIGAAQLAVAIAAPIPKFKHGKNLNEAKALDKYEGPAVVGDGNKSELIVRKDGSMEVTPSKPTLTWLGQDDIVHPDANKVLQTTYKTTDRVLAGNVTVNPIVDFEPMSNEIKSMKKEVVTAIKNKTENHFHSPNPIKLLMQKNGDGWTKYL